MAHALSIHPGFVLQELYLDDSGITQSALASAIGIPASRISELCNGKRDITADYSVRLGRFFGLAPHFFAQMQANHDVFMAEEKIRRAKVRIRPWSHAEDAPAQALAAT
jgi:addiction module HigA family antidote